MEIRSLHAAELPAWFDHVCHVFTNTSREYFMNHWFEDPDRQLAGILVAVENGRIASTLRVFHRQTIIGGALVRLGGIGEVATHPDFRRQGLSGKLLQESIAYMQQIGCGLSVLFTGLYEHYARHGWEAVPIPSLRVDQTDLASVVASGAAAQIRPIDYAVDLYALADIYTACAGQLAGPLARTPDYWWTYIRRAMQPGLVAVADGRIVGYIRMQLNKNKDVMQISEFGVLPSAGGCIWPLMQAAVGKMDVPSGLPLRLPQAVDNLAGGALSSHLAAQPGVWSSPMYRVIDPLQLAMQMRAIWRQRLADDGWEGCIRLETGMGSICLSMNAGHLDITEQGVCESEINLTHRQFLLALLSGYEQAALNMEAMAPAAAHLMQVLFPPITHVYWSADGF